MANGEPAYRSTQVLRWVYTRGISSFEEMTDIGRVLRRRLAETFSLPRLDVAQVAAAPDGTQKLLFRLADGAGVESVIIPDPPRLTFCVSSQAGCAMGCSFCATGRRGLDRNLSVAEITGQVAAANRRLAEGVRLTNIVFMGMGEPLHNCDAVIAALHILTSRTGFGISPRRITVSTVGLVPQMQRLVQETRVNIAVSLAATTDALRNRLIPVNRRYPLKILLHACQRLPLRHRQRITFEHVLLGGVNDTREEARRLIRRLQGVRCKVNLIPFNPFPGSGFCRPADGVTGAFLSTLREAGIQATVRASRGPEVAAACGQLTGSASGDVRHPHAVPGATGSEGRRQWRSSE